MRTGTGGSLCLPKGKLAGTARRQGVGLSGTAVTPIPCGGRSGGWRGVLRLGGAGMKEIRSKDALGMSAMLLSIV